MAGKEVKILKPVFVIACCIGIVVGCQNPSGDKPSNNDEKSTSKNQTTTGGNDVVSRDESTSGSAGTTTNTVAPDDPADLAVNPAKVNQESTDADHSGKPDRIHFDLLADQPVLDTKLPPVDEKWVRVSPDQEVWIDVKGKQVIVGGRICLTEGPLEMFACPAHTKEHESIVATNASGQTIHAGLVGHRSGTWKAY
ncbi:MAG: YdjY domain-containing protein [Pirellulaceae bacterium]